MGEREQEGEGGDAPLAEEGGSTQETQTLIEGCRKEVVGIKPRITRRARMSIFRRAGPCPAAITDVEPPPSGKESSYARQRLGVSRPVGTAPLWNYSSLICSPTMRVNLPQLKKFSATSPAMPNPTENPRLLRDAVPLSVPTLPPFASLAPLASNSHPLPVALLPFTQLQNPLAEDRDQR